MRSSSICKKNVFFTCQKNKCCLPFPKKKWGCLPFPVCLLGQDSLRNVGKQVKFKLGLVRSACIGQIVCVESINQIWCILWACMSTLIDLTHLHLTSVDVSWPVMTFLDLCWLVLSLKETFPGWRPIGLSVRPIGLSVRPIGLSARPIGLSGLNENKANSASSWAWVWAELGNSGHLGADKPEIRVADGHNEKLLWTSRDYMTRLQDPLYSS